MIRPGEQGDILRLFALDQIKLSVTPLREADGKKLLHEEEARHGLFLSIVDTIDFRAVETLVSTSLKCSSQEAADGAYAVPSSLGLWHQQNQYPSFA